MKQVKLNRITIQNFKGIANGEFNFNGNTDITTDVMQGKTSIKEAYLFCFGIDIDNFYPVDKNNQYIDGLETRIDVTLTVDDIEYTLSRSAKVKYKTDKENQTKLFDGFKKDIFEFDRVPCNTTEFKEKLTTLFGIEDFDTFKYLTILNYFNEQVDWKTRRELIYNLYVDQKAIDQLKDNEKYNLIANELKKGYKSSDVATILNSENNRLVDDKRKNEILLADKQNEIQNYADIDYSVIEEQLNDIEKQISKEEERISKLNVNTKKDEIEAQVSELENKKLNLEREDNQTKNSMLNKLTSLENKVANAKNKGLNLENDITNKTKEYKELKALEYDNSKEICPTCHQTLPQAQIDTIRQDFDNYKDNKLKTLTSAIKSLKTQYDEYKNEYTDLLAQLNAQKEEFDNFKANAEIETLSDKISELKTALNNVEDIKIDTTKLNELKSKKYELTTELGNKNAQQKCKERIEQLLNNQKEIANAEILLAKRRKQLEEYTLDIIALVNDSINSHFSIVKFKLFEQLTATAKKDIKETLIVTHNGVEYSAMSTGEKAMANLDIVTTLQNTLGINLPIWVDDASITNFKTLPNNQMIFLLNEKGAKLNCTKISDIY